MSLNLYKYVIFSTHCRRLCFRPFQGSRDRKCRNAGAAAISAGYVQTASQGGGMERQLLVLALGMFAMGTDNFVVAGILPGVAQSLHTSVSVAGQMVTLYALTYAVMAPVMAALLGTWPRKLVLVMALAIFVA